MCRRLLVVVGVVGVVGVIGVGLVMGVVCLVVVAVNFV